MVRTGLQYAQSLKDGRQIFINGEIAGDLAEHPAFRHRAPPAPLGRDPSYHKRDRTASHLFFLSASSEGG